MIKMWKRLLAIAVALALTLSMGVVAWAEEETVVYSLAADGVMTTIPLTEANLGSFTDSGTYADDGSVTFASDDSNSIKTVSYKLPDSYSEGTKLYVHITGTNNGSTTERAYLITGYDTNADVSSAIFSMPSGTIDLWTEFTVGSKGSAKEILFKGYTYDAAISNLTVSSVEIFVGTAAQYTCAVSGHTYVNGVCTVCGDEEDHCTDLLTAGNVTDNSQTAVSISDGSVALDSSTGWIAVKLDRTYLPGESVTVHIEGTTDATVRWYLSEAYYGSGNITDPTVIAETGDFDVTYTFTVKTDTSYSGAVYINVKPASDVSAFSNLTITHLGVVQYGITVEDSVGGTVVADKSGANTGETVTLTVTPKDSYSLSSLSVTDASGNAVTVSEASEGYTFTMPSSKVTVTATFADTCENTIDLSNLSLHNVTLTDGVYTTETQYNGYIYVPIERLSTGETIQVHIVGVSNGCDMRIWLGTNGEDSSGECSSVYYTSSYSDGEEIDISFSLTATADCNVIEIKGQTAGLNLSITHIGITYPEAEVAVPEFYGRTLTLDGKIGVTYYFDMTGVTNPSSYVLKATVGSGTEQTYKAGETKTIGDVEYYRYTVYVGVADINTEITAVLTDGTNSVDVSGYSVANYCSAVESGGLPESELCTALLTYGNYAGIYNSKTGVGLGDYMLADGFEVSIEESEFGSTVTRTDGYEKTLVLDDEISIRLYMTTEQTVYVNGVAYAPESNTDSNSGDYPYRVDIPVPAKDMNEMYEICDENGEVLTKYSVYSYILNKQDDSDENLANLVKAIYNYSLEAEKYTGWI